MSTNNESTSLEQTNQNSNNNTKQTNKSFSHQADFSNNKEQDLKEKQTDKKITNKQESSQKENNLSQQNDFYFQRISLNENTLIWEDVSLKNISIGDIEKVYSEFGEIVEIIIRNSFCYIQFQKKKDAQKALEQKPNITINDKKINVKLGIYQNSIHHGRDLGNSQGNTKTNSNNLNFQENSGNVTNYQLNRNTRKRSFRGDKNYLDKNTFIKEDDDDDDDDDDDYDDDDGNDEDDNYNYDKELEKETRNIKKKSNQELFEDKNENENENEYENGNEREKFGLKRSKLNNYKKEDNYPDYAYKRAIWISVESDQKRGAVGALKKLLVRKFNILVQYELVPRNSTIEELANDGKNTGYRYLILLSRKFDHDGPLTLKMVKANGSVRTLNNLTINDIIPKNYNNFSQNKKSVSRTRNKHGTTREKSEIKKQKIKTNDEISYKTYLNQSLNGNTNTNQNQQFLNYPMTQYMRNQPQSLPQLQPQLHQRTPQYHLPQPYNPYGYRINNPQQTHNTNFPMLNTQPLRQQQRQNFLSHNPQRQLSQINRNPIFNNNIINQTTQKTFGNNLNGSTNIGIHNPPPNQTYFNNLNQNIQKRDNNQNVNQNTINSVKQMPLNSNWNTFEK